MFFSEENYRYEFYLKIPKLMQSEEPINTKNWTVSLCCKSVAHIQAKKKTGWETKIQVYSSKSQQSKQIKYAVIN